MGLSEVEVAEITVANIVCSSLSLIGSCFVIVMYLGFKEIRSFPFRLVVYLSICDALFALGVLLGPVHESLCQFQAFFVSYFSVGTILWTIIIARTLYLAVIRQVPNVEDYEWKFLAFGFGMPLIGAVLPFTTGSYGEADVGMCWVSLRENKAVGSMWQLFQFYLPLWFAFFYNSYCYYQVRRVVKIVMSQLRSGGEDGSRMRKVGFGRFRFFPLLLIICWSFSTVNRIYLFINPDEPSVELSILAMSFGSIQGLLNAFLYGLNPAVLSALRNSCYKSMPCLGKPSYPLPPAEQELPPQI